MKVYVVREVYRDTAKIESVWDTEENAHGYLNSSGYHHCTPSGAEYWTYSYRDGEWVNLCIEEWEVKS